MSEPMRKPHTNDVIEITVHGTLPTKFTIARSNSSKLLTLLLSLQVHDHDNDTVPVDKVFKGIDKKYGKVGATVRGLRIRDELTQKKLAAKLSIHQVHISQIEHGKRAVGKKLAQKFADVFHTDYQLFL